MRKRLGWMGAAALALLAGQALAQPSQGELDAFARTLDVGYRVLDNRPGTAVCKPDPSCMLAQITLTASQTPAAGWSLYFSSVDKIIRAGGDDFVLTHINGDLYRLTPTASFGGFAAGRAIVVPLRLEGHQLSELYPMPNYYVAADGLAARTVESTRPRIDPETGMENLPFVQAFTDEARLAGGSAADLTQWATAPRVFAANVEVGTRPQAVPRAAILPTPLSTRLDPGGGGLDLSHGVAVSLAGASRPDLAAALARLAKAGVVEARGGTPLKVRVAPGRKLAAGGYRLTIDARSVEVLASTLKGPPTAWPR